MNEAANEHPLKYPSPDESVAYLDDIDAMSLEELEKRLPEAQEALETIESKLEELPPQPPPPPADERESPELFWPTPPPGLMKQAPTSPTS